MFGARKLFITIKVHSLVCWHYSKNTKFRINSIAIWQNKQAAEIKKLYNKDCRYNFNEISLPG